MNYGRLDSLGVVDNKYRRIKTPYSKPYVSLVENIPELYVMSTHQICSKKTMVDSVFTEETALMMMGNKFIDQKQSKSFSVSFHL